MWDAAGWPDFARESLGAEDPVPTPELALKRVAIAQRFLEAGGSSHGCSPIRARNRLKRGSVRTVSKSGPEMLVGRNGSRVA